MKTLLALGTLFLVSCSVDGFKITPPPANPQAATKATPAAAPNVVLPEGCARDCDEGRANCLRIPESLLAGHPAEIERVSVLIKESVIGVDNFMTLGKNGRLRAEGQDGIAKAFSFTIKPTKRISYRRVESSIPKIEIVSGKDIPRWFMDTPELTTDWSGSLRTVEVVDDGLVMDFSGNCLGLIKRQAL
jgi:hypothetical protein